MAKIVGVGTGFSGKVGNLKYRTVKGIQIVQSMSIPHNPKTSKQLSNRSVFSQLNTLFKPLSGTLIKDFWNPFVIGKRSGWSVLISENLKIFSSIDFDFEKLIITKGSLPGEISTVSKYDSRFGACQVWWSILEPAGSDPLDYAQVLYYDKLHNKWYSFQGSSFRSTGLIFFSIPPDLDAREILSYLFFFSGKLSPKSVKSVSNSCFRQVTR